MGREAAPNGDDTSASSKSAPPAITLPKGGGAIKGIGEKFAANPVTGTGSMSVPIATSAGRSGFAPQLSLSYDSGSGNGPFGFGWTLSLPSITRKTDKGLPQYHDAIESDVFLLSGAEDLVPVLIQNAQGEWERERLPTRTVNHVTYRVDRYRPRIEGLFARIERWTNTGDAADMFWRSISKDNITTWYGKTADSRIADPADPSRIFSWLICQSHDDKGNVIVYGYKPEDSARILEDASGTTQGKAHERNRTDASRSAQRYLKYIRYGNQLPHFPVLATDTPWPEPADASAADGSKAWYFEAVFDYGEHDTSAPKPSDLGRWPARADPFSSYRAGFEVRTYRICQRVLMFHHFPGEEGVGANCLVRSTDFDYSYEQDPGSSRNPVYTFLCAVTQNGYRRDGDGYLKRSLPPVEFEYTEPVVQDAVEEVDPASLENLPVGIDGSAYQWTDLHGEGIPGVLTEQAGTWFYKRNLSPIPEKRPDGGEWVKAQFAPLETVALKPNVALATGAQFMDLAGDGQPDLVVLDGATPGLYEHDTEEGWQPFRPFTSRLNRNTRDPNLKLVDLDGDGHADVLITEDDALIWHASLAEAGFGAARRVAQQLDEEKGPRLVFADGSQSIYLADLSGDGLTDLVRIRNGEVCYWPNLGYGRFGAKVTMDHSPWFDNAEQFDQKRIRLADIDGTGTTDILYLHRDGVRLYFNQSGNGWSEAQTLAVFPRVDSLVSIVPADLLGNGTACLVWSSPLTGDGRRPMRYVNLMGGQKPHLLVRTINNLGAETRVDYAPSTKFYLQDKRDGKPWITRLPFPVHVVERVETYDHISGNRFVARYAYHHGYFDGEEREFRGFAMVEQWDTEEFATLNPEGELSAGTNIDASSHVPPVLTKTWFHTGVYLGRNHVSDFFAGLLDARDKGEYYREPGLTDEEAAALGLDEDARQLYDDARAKERLLDDTIVPQGLALDEEREACRALKGSMLRQEIYALDADRPEATPEQVRRAQTPYSVTEQNFTIRMLQPQSDNRHGVYFTHAREALSSHYERDPEDPRVQHALTLEVDDYGNVLKSAASGYGRRKPHADLPAAEKAKQAQILIAYTENSVTKPIETADDHRTPLLYEARSYELTGLTEWQDDYAEALVMYLRPKGRNRFSLDEILEAGSSATALDYGASPTAGWLQKRLIEHLRTYYRSNELDGRLALGELQSLALPFESYKLAFTPGLLREVFQRPLDLIRPPGVPPPEDLLPTPAGVLAVDPHATADSDRGGYVHLDGDGRWWIPTGQVFYSPGSDDTASEEDAYARGHFFLPHRYRDPFHTDVFRTETHVDYDAYDLLVRETRDSLENRVSVAAHDYRVLQPALIVDPNGNRSAVAFDALGLVVGTAVMGKAPPATAEGDLLTSDFDTDLTAAQRDAFFDADDPHTLAADLLRDATTRIVYDLDRFRRSRQANPSDPTKWQPACAATLARETHASSPLPTQGLRIQLSFSYSDGFGREIQKKIQAEPGPGPQRGADGKIQVGADGQPVMTTDDISPRWVGSGWTVFNNKGKPVRQYEPFFTDTHRFDFDVRIGVSPVLFYDPVERVVATLHPNHTWEKVVFDPWRQQSWDVNDTLLIADPKSDTDVGDFFRRLPDADYLPTWYKLRTEAAHAAAFAVRNPDATDRANETWAAEKARIHAATPTVAHADALGRTVLSVAHNRFMYSDSPEQEAPVEEKYDTRVILDIEGNQREVIDAKGRLVMRYHYDLLGNRIHQASMEAGERWMLNDVTGKPIRAWDSRGFQRRMTYDALRRPTGLYVSDNGQAERLAEKTLYGDTPGALSAPEQTNHRGKPYQVYDDAGVVTSEAYDFKGNLLESRRQLRREYKHPADWQQEPELEAESFQSSTRYDALNRVIQMVAPHSDQEGAKCNILRPGYNEANLLERIDGWLQRTEGPEGLLDLHTADQPFVKNIDYDAKGQRTRIEYGNGAVTSYEYDPLTFRLTRLQTTRPAQANGLAAQIFKSAGAVQDLRYTYDPAGNITSIADESLRVIHHDQQAVEAVGRYTYDALYRLIEAQGREHIGQSVFQLNPPDCNYRDHPFAGHGAQPNDTTALRRYTEQYVYDAVGNFLSFHHQAKGDTWQRDYFYEESSLVTQLGVAGNSNRLSRTILHPNGAQPLVEAYTHDAHGNITQMPHLSLMEWDFKDQLSTSSRQVVNNGCTPETNCYVYDAAGQRVRKVTERQAAEGEMPTRMKERLYLGGFEIYREYDGGGENGTKERESLHVMDDKQRIALVETATLGGESASELGVPVIRYQLGNHLGSASLELDRDGGLISYEGYHPYGTTAFQAGRSLAEISLKRYRYTGKERDEETGFNHHGARYYALWLGRWCSCDPIGIDSGISLYCFVNNNPVKSVDLTGTDDRPPPLDLPKVDQPIFYGYDAAGASVLVLGANATDVQGSADSVEEPVIELSISGGTSSALAGAGSTQTNTQNVGDTSGDDTSQPTVSSTRLAIAGLSNGVVQGLLPLGELYVPSSHPESSTYEFARGSGQIIGGFLASTILGPGMVVGGGLGGVIGLAAEGPSGGTSTVVTVGGGVVAVAGLAVTAGGIVNIGMGVVTIVNAASLPTPSGSLRSGSMRGRSVSNPRSGGQMQGGRWDRIIPSKHASPEYRKAQAELRQRTINDPDAPLHIREWLKQQRKVRGPNAARWRNPPGYDTGHVDPDDLSKGLRWETASQNRSRGGQVQR